MSSDKEFDKLLRLVNSTEEAEKKAKKELNEMKKKKEKRTNITAIEVKELEDKYREAVLKATEAKKVATEAAIQKRKANEKAEREAAFEREKLINELEKGVVESRGTLAPTKTAAQLKFEEEFLIKEALKEANRKFKEQKTRRITRFKNLTSLPRNNVEKLLNNINNLEFEFNNDENEDKIVHFIKLAHAANMDVHAVIKIIEKGLPYTSEAEGIAFFKSLKGLDLNLDDFVEFVVALNRRTGIRLKEILGILDEIREEVEDRNLDRSYYSDAQIRDIIILAHKANVPAATVMEYLDEGNDELKLSEKVSVLRLKRSKTKKNTKISTNKRNSTKKSKTSAIGTIKNNSHSNNRGKTARTIRSTKPSYATVAKRVEAVKDTYRKLKVKIPPIEGIPIDEIDKVVKAIGGYFKGGIFKRILTKEHYKNIPKDIEVYIPKKEGKLDGYAFVEYKDHEMAEAAYEFMKSEKEKPVLELGKLKHTIGAKDVEPAYGDKYFMD